MLADSCENDTVTTIFKNVISIVITFNYFSGNSHGYITSLFAFDIHSTSQEEPKHHIQLFASTSKLPFYRKNVESKVYTHALLKSAYSNNFVLQLFFRLTGTLYSSIYIIAGSYVLMF